MSKLIFKISELIFKIFKLREIIFKTMEIIFKINEDIFEINCIVIFHDNTCHPILYIKHQLRRIPLTEIKIPLCS